MKTWILGLTQGISKQTHSLFPPVTFLCTVYLFLTYRKVTIICCVDIVKWTIKKKKKLGTWALFEVGICMRILLFPFMPHVGNTRRVRKPWPHIFYNTIGHPFQHCINAVPQFDFFSLVNRVFPKPTFVRCSPVRLVIFSTSHVILNMCFPIAKVFAIFGRYTWRFPTVNTHFELVPSCISYCEIKKITVRAKAQLNGHEVWYDRYLHTYILLCTIFMYIFHVLLTRLPNL